MKKITITILIMMLCIVTKAQDHAFPTNEDGKYEFSEVVESDLSKATLYANATSWAVDFYDVDYKEALQLASEKEGRIVIKYFDGVLYGNNDNKSQFINLKREYLKYTLTIECKEKKYRYTINEIEINPCLDVAHPHETRLERLNECIKDKNGLEEQIRKLEKELSGKKLDKEKKRINDLIEKLNIQIKEHQFVYDEEYNIIDRIVKSLKKKMIKNNDF